MLQENGVCQSQVHEDVDPQNYIRTVFTPYDDGLAAYIALLSGAKKSIYVATYSMTDKSIVDKLIELKNLRNVQIHILLDFSETQGRSAGSEEAAISALKQAGIEVVTGNSERAHQLMHDKYTVIDDEWVESGSWNYTRAANKQDNVFDIIRSPKRARLFKNNWERMYAVMKAQQTQRERSELFKSISFVLLATAILGLLAVGVILAWQLKRKQKKSTNR